MCVGLRNWLPVNISVALHGAECGIDLSSVMMVSDQVKPLRLGSFYVAFGLFRAIILKPKSRC